jgi:8-oxo-dGTP diphosphatase
VHAAGAVPWRERDGRLEVALIHRPRYKDWSWPKGKLDPGESLPAAACREVAEETGTPVVLGAPLPTLRYLMPDGVRKEVRYWAARVATDADAAALEARDLVRRAPLTEIDDVVWVSAATATDLLTRPTDRKPLDVVTELHAAGRLATRVLAVARHGRAKQRSAWSKGEATRPLTAQGEAQGRALVDVLAAFGVGEVVTSPWARCLRTVTPYAERTGLTPRELDALTEDAVRADPRAAVRTVSALLADARDAVVCTHRPALGAVLPALAEATRRWTTGTVPDTDPWLRTGEVLVAHVAGTGPAARVVAVETHRPAHPE